MIGGQETHKLPQKTNPAPPPPLTHRVGADCKVREVRADGTRPLMPSRASARRPIYLYWLFSLTRRYHVARLTPADSHGARSCSSGVPALRPDTGRHAALAPTDKPALAPPCGLFPEPALLMPLDAPSCPVAAHRPPPPRGGSGIEPGAGVCILRNASTGSSVNPCRLRPC